MSALLLTPSACQFMSSTLLSSPSTCFVPPFACFVPPLPKKGGTPNRQVHAFFACELPQYRLIYEYLYHMFHMYHVFEQQTIKTKTKTLHAHLLLKYMLSIKKGGTCGTCGTKPIIRPRGAPPPATTTGHFGHHQDAK
jgi:hypothetical protein